jgi:glycosyltransferase involved in cell wall biosynthesis
MDLTSQRKISVALCTRNGALYLPEQLRSIADQTRLPDELVVCDDNSTDETIAIVQEFAARAPFAVRALRNSVALGVTKNFEKAIGLCTGDVIALSDQDDYWCLDRLEATETALIQRPEAGAVFGDAEIVDSRLNPLGRRLWQAVRFGRQLHRQVEAGNAFEALLHYNFVTGATLAFRSKYRALVSPLPPECVHDSWIALLISAVSPVICIDRPVILYREHSSQQIGAKRKAPAEEFLSATKRRNRERYRRKLDQYQRAYDRLDDAREFQTHPRAQRLMCEKLQHLNMRAELPAGYLQRVSLIAGDWIAGRYHRFGSGWRSAVRDLIVNLET